MSNRIDLVGATKDKSIAQSTKLNHLILSNNIDSYIHLNSLVQKKQPHLTVFDISQHLYPSKIQLTLRKGNNNQYNLLPNSKFHDETSLIRFKQDMNKLLTMFHSVLSPNGFLAIKVNGTFKAIMRRLLDSIFHQNNFMNEIIINSPFKIQYSKEINFFERNDYFLLYSVSTNRKINAVFDDKESGGYWHSFVSKGQGSAKTFLINGELVLLEPPSGTHWKLKQESILELCKNGQIRLNKKGNPEYWVQPKIGQVVDSNWLDLELTKNNSHQNRCFSRLYEVLMMPKQLMVIVNPRDSSSVIEASTFGLNWICLVEDEKSLENLEVALQANNVEYIRKIIKTSIGSKRNIHSTSLTKNDIEESSSSVTSHDLRAITYYPTKSSIYPPTNHKFLNTLIRGDCKHVLRLLEEKYCQTLKLIYIDPPFYTGYDEILYIPFQSKDNSNNTKKDMLNGSIKTIAYKNVLVTNSPISDFKRWFKERILSMKPLLSLDGFIFVRFDYHFGHYAKEVLNEVFGLDNFVIEFTIRRMKKNLSEKQLNQQTRLIVHSDSLFVYRRSNQSKFRLEGVNKNVRKGQDKAEVEYSHDNLWLDIAGYQKVKRTIYPTENSETLLKRVIELSTEEGDIIADFFAGSGTTLSVAEQNNRRWLGIDIGLLSINEIRKRILQIEKRSPFEYHELIDTHSDLESGNDGRIDFDLKIEKKKSPQGINVLLTITNLVHTPSIKKLYDSLLIDVIDYWEVDWNYDKNLAIVSWNSYRQIRRKKVEKRIPVSTSHTYSQENKAIIWVNIVDIFGNSSYNTIEVDLR